MTNKKHGLVDRGVVHPSCDHIQSPQRNPGMKWSFVSHSIENMLSSFIYDYLMLTQQMR